MVYKSIIFDNDSLIGTDNELRCFDMRTQRVLWKISEFSDSVWDVHFVGNRLIVASHDHSVSYYETVL